MACTDGLPPPRLPFSAYTRVGCLPTSPRRQRRRNEGPLSPPPTLYFFVHSPFQGSDAPPSLILLGEQGSMPWKKEKKRKRREPIKTLPASILPPILTLLLRGGGWGGVAESPQKDVFFKQEYFSTVLVSKAHIWGGDVNLQPEPPPPLIYRGLAKIHWIAV